MRAARKLNYIGIINAVLVLAVWYGYRIYWSLWEEWKSGVGIIEIFSSLNGYQKMMALFPLMLLTLLLRVQIAIPNEVLASRWVVLAGANVVIGLWICATSWFILLVGGGLKAIALGLLPCLVACIVIILLFCVRSPLNVGRQN